MGILVGGCSSSSTSTAQNSSGVAGLLAQSMPGAVSQNGQNVTAAAQTAANSPNPNTITTALNTANGTTTTPGTVSTTLSPASIMAAIAAVQAANAAQQQNPQTSPNAIGPGVFMAGPGPIGVNTFQGPPAFVVRPSN